MKPLAMICLALISSTPLLAEVSDSDLMTLIPPGSVLTLTFQDGIGIKPGETSRAFMHGQVYQDSNFLPSSNGDDDCWCTLDLAPSDSDRLLQGNKAFTLTARPKAIPATEDKFSIVEIPLNSSFVQKMVCVSFDHYQSKGTVAPPSIGCFRAALGGYMDLKLAPPIVEGP